MLITGLVRIRVRIADRTPMLTVIVRSDEEQGITIK